MLTLEKSVLKVTFPSLHQRRLTLSVQWVLRLLIDAPHSNLFKEIKDDRLLKRLAKALKLNVENLCDALCPFRVEENRTLEITSRRVRYLAQRNLEKLQMIRQYEREMREILEDIDDEYREEEISGPIEILYSKAAGCALFLSTNGGEYFSEIGRRIPGHFNRTRFKSVVRFLRGYSCHIEFRANGGASKVVTK